MIDDLLFRRSYIQRVLSVAPDALIGYWPLSEPSGAAAIEQTRRAANGAHVGVTLGQPGPDGGGAPLYDGINDYTSVYSAALAAAFSGLEGTLAVWARVNGAGVWTDATVRHVATFRFDGSNQIAIRRSATSNTLTFQYLAGATNKTVSPSGLSSTDWMHLLMTWSKSADEMKAYLNGVQVGTTQTGLGTWAGTLNSTRVNVGTDAQTPTNPWSGYAAHCPVWTRALTAGEVAESYRLN